jgi:hypothetical protein
VADTHQVGVGLHADFVPADVISLLNRKIRRKVREVIQ